jgi:hypothetical protein
VTLISEEFEDDYYPSNWCDVDPGIEARRIALDTFELRSETHVMLLDREGFDLYLKQTEKGDCLDFKAWCKNHNVESRQREDI